MRILLATEGTYPYVLGGVSTWCDQLIRGLAEHQFHILAVVGPRPVKPVFSRPSNVTSTSTVHLWKRRGNLRRSSRAATASFGTGLTALLSFAEADLQGFAAGLRQLARIGSHTDLWPLFETDEAWNEVRRALQRLLGEPPKVAEVTLALHWLRATLVPLLYIPPAADQAHTVSNSLCAIPAWLMAREYDVPLMLTEHGLYLRERYLAFSSERDSPGVKLLRASFYRATARLMYRDSRLVVSVSEFNRAWQIRLGAPIERTRVVYNGVAPQFFPLAAAGAQQAPTISWVGRIDPLKDLETLIHSFRHVKPVVKNAMLRLYGPIPKGNEWYFDKLTRLVSSCGLDGDVTFEGPITPVHRAYHTADVVVLSSISEGFPYTPIEAMMCGKPVVATRVGGVGEAIGSVGRLVEPRNPEELGAALAELLLNQPLRHALGREARSRALEHFTLDQMNGAYRQLYADLFTPQPAWTAA
jgi:glycosyltransferase involved in cell wall biosynthesis